MIKVNSPDELRKVFIEKNVKNLEEYCDDCEDVKPLEHFKFVDGVVSDHPAGYAVFSGSSTCKSSQSKKRSE